MHDIRGVGAIAGGGARSMCILTGNEQYFPRISF